MMSAAPSVSPTENVSSQRLHCMEIIGGNRTAHHQVSSPGLDIWVDSRPLAGVAGGDIHYLSSCGSGRVTRIALADISGHGPDMDQIAGSLRKLMRKYINLLDQTRFARAINREFTAQADSDYFATVLLVTYFAPTDHLIICNAGHPPPLWYNSRRKSWQRLDQDIDDPGPSIAEAKGTYMLKPVANLPLGIIEPTQYHQFSVKLEPSDYVLLYTDAAIESRNKDDRQLGQEGLLHLVQDLRPTRIDSLGEQVLARLDEWRQGTPAEDDQTLIILHHNAANPPRMSLGQAVKTMAKIIGLSKV